MSELAFTKACMALARMYADILVINQKQLDRDRLPAMDLRKPLVDLVYMSRIEQDFNLGPAMRLRWAEVISNELVEAAVKDYDNSYISKCK